VRRTRAWLAAAICLALLVGAMAGIIVAEKKAMAAQGDKAPNFALKDTSGKIHKLSEFKGKVVLLNWFATW